MDSIQPPKEYWCAKCDASYGLIHSITSHGLPATTCPKGHHVWLDRIAQGIGAQEPDLINHPPHYMSKTGLEAIEVIEAFDLNYNLGVAVAYLLRCERKGNKAQDIKKAIWHLTRELGSEQVD